MITQNKTEAWLSGPAENIPALLQPVAHALLQAREEVAETVAGFPDAYLWQKPANVASVGFHLQHLAGVLDRLLTYARGESLSTEQLEALSSEGKFIEGRSTVAELTGLFNAQIEKALEQLKATDEHTLTDTRLVGRAQIPSTLIGLLVHSAEHTMRHVGQLHVTVKVVQDRLKTGL